MGDAPGVVTPAIVAFDGLALALVGVAAALDGIALAGVVSVFATLNTAGCSSREVAFDARPEVVEK